MPKVPSIRRCPLIKVTKKEIIYNSEGIPTSETITEELNDCYKQYCMAWNEKSCSCMYFDTPTFLTDEDDGKPREQ